MDQFDKKMKMRAQEEPFSLPEDYAGRVFLTCASLEEKTVNTTRKTVRRTVAGIAAALALFVTIPNVSASAASVMGSLPVLGPVVQVLTFRHYTEDTANIHADVAVPQVEGSGKAAAEVNAQVQAYTDRLLSQFKDDCKTLGTSYESLDVTYQVVSDTDSWFTLRVDGLATQASGYEFSKIYNINKTSDQVVILDGLFREGTDWQSVLNTELRRQMQAQMADPSGEKSYFMEEFKGVDKSQNYYFNQDGNLVLAFDEYTIAPGSMGAPEFTIAKDVYRNLLR